MNSDVKLLETRRFGDSRGWFAETYSEARLAAEGVTCRFVQDNQSRSTFIGTIRGIHFQRPPHAQAKLVRCLRGSVMDYAVDLRRGSPTYGRHVAAELSEDNGRQLFIPVGFGHAFVTLTPDAEIAYKVSDVYAPDCDGGVIWNDPAIGIDWPLPTTGPVLSDKDAVLPSLAAFDSPFEYDGRPLAPLVIPA
nr:dTDP-4-dehydrorhamnose 3,5-epimerase [uncultured Brevundimonas sp.]